MNSEPVKNKTHQNCSTKMKAVVDALDALNGKWKLPILISLAFGAKRFKEISKATIGITDRMLSKELKQLEINQLVSRTIHNTFPPTVEYSITDHGKSLSIVINGLADWGVLHRKRITSREL